MSSTANLHRVIKAPLSRVFRAFSNPEALASWMPPFGFVGQIQSFDFKQGGSFKMSFMNFTNESKNSFGGTFKVIMQNELLVFSDKFDDPNMPGEITNTISFKEVACGTELTIKQEGIPAMIPVEMCYLGWQESLIKLAQLVEPEINQ